MREQAWRLGVEVHTLIESEMQPKYTYKEGSVVRVMKVTGAIR